MPLTEDDETSSEESGSTYNTELPHKVDEGIVFLVEVNNSASKVKKHQKTPKESETTNPSSIKGQVCCKNCPYFKKRIEEYKRVVSYLRDENYTLTQERDGWEKMYNLRRGPRPTTSFSSVQDK